VPNTRALNGLKNEGNKAIPLTPKGVDTNNNNKKKRKEKRKYILKGLPSVLLLTEAKTKFLIRLQLKQSQLRKLVKCFKIERDT